MTVGKPRLLLFVLVVMLTGFAGSALAVPLPFEDGFENIAVGDYPDENGWDYLFSGRSAYVSNEAAYSGVKSYRLDSEMWWARMEYVSLDTIPDHLTYEASVCVHPTDGWVGLVGFMEGYSNQGPMWNFFWINHGDGEVAFTGTSKISLVPYTAGDWCTVRADLDFTTNTAILWVNGAVVATDVPIAPKQFSHPVLGNYTLHKWGVNSTNYYQYGGSANVVYFDDLRVYESTGTITGTVTQDGLPLAGVPVYLLPRMSEGEWNNQIFDNLALGISDAPANYALAAGLSAADGSYEFQGVPLGEYEVAATFSGSKSEAALRRAPVWSSLVTEADYEMLDVDHQYVYNGWLYVTGYPRPGPGQSTLVTYWIDPGLNSDWQKAIRYALELWGQVSRDYEGSDIPYLVFAASPESVADIRFRPASLPAGVFGSTISAFYADLAAWLAHSALYGTNLVFIDLNTENLSPPPPLPQLAFGTDEAPLYTSGPRPPTDPLARWFWWYENHDLLSGEQQVDRLLVAIHEVGHALGLGHTDALAYPIMRPWPWVEDQWDRFLGWGDVRGIQAVYTPAPAESPLTIAAACPVDLSVEDPLGRTIDKFSNSIPDAWYIEVDQNHDGSPEDTIVFDSPLDGVYLIQVTPEALAAESSGETYSLYVVGGDSSTQLASEAPVPDEPQVFEAALEQGEVLYDSPVFEPPVTNSGFALKDGTTVPIKFHLLDCEGMPITEQRNITLEVTGPDALGVETTYVFCLSDGGLKYDGTVSPPHYVANFSTKVHSVLDGGSYTAEVKEDGAPIGSIGFDVSTSSGVGRGNKPA